MWILIFTVVTLLLILLPLIPAILELNLATDTQPLRVIQEYDTDITHFATGFKSYLEKSFPNFFAQLGLGGVKFQDGSLDNRNRFQIIGHNSVPFFDQKEVNAASTNKLLVSAEPLVLPGNMFYESEVYSTSSIKTGTNSQFRALLAESDIELAEGCSVSRWVHSGGSLFVSANCQLFGRASASQNLFVAENTQFDRLNARQITFGQMRAIINPYWAKNTPVNLEDIAKIKDHFDRRWLIDGDLEIPAGSLFDGDIVATRDVNIGAGSHITGSLKSNRNLVLGAGVRVDGSVFSAGDLTLEAGCRIMGPVVAEGTLLIKESTIVGAENTPTTISAQKIIVSGGVTTYGTVWADEGAYVVSMNAAAA